MLKNKLLLSALTIALAAALVGGVTMAWFTAKAAAPTNEFTAGTVMIEASTATIYGVEYKNPENQAGTLYEIFVDDDSNSVSYTKLYDSTKRALNALALDRKNRRLYYADGNGFLYFYDFNDGVGDKAAGKIFVPNTKIYNAAFGLGHYWFVKEGTDDLYKISFKPDGTIDQVILAHQDFTGPYNRSFGFGDIAMDMRDGIIYGSTSGSGSNSTFFTYNVSTGVYAEYPAGAKNMQLAFGADGTLYGTVTRQFKWYRVNPSNGTPTLFYTGDKMFGDLASNFQNNWNPGDCDMVRYRITNTGSKKINVRANLTGQWDGGLGGQNIAFALCGSMNPAHWKIDGNTFYYLPEIAPGGSVELCLLVCLSGPGTGDEYQGASYLLQPVFEAIQSSNFAPYYEWGVTYYGVP